MDTPLKHANNRRQQDRLATDADVNCVVWHPLTGEALQAWARDLSVGGVCLLLPVRFEAGQHLSLELKHTSRGTTLQLTVEVRHAEIYCPNDTWLHGSRFLKELSKEELQLFL